MKNLKKVLSCLVTGVFTISCTKIDNVFNGNKDTNRFGIPTENVNFKINNEPIVPKILTFESKVPIKTFKLVEKLPEGKNFDFKFEVNPKKLKKNIIKISENGDFKLTIKKGNKFSVIDNDATDGNATIEIPESAINSFIGIPEKEDAQKSNSTAKLTIEDTLYYEKQEVKPLSKKELEAIFEKNKKEDDKKFEVKKENPENDKKEYESWYTDEREDGTWYQIGKRPVPIPSEWKSDNGVDYVLSFKNQGIKQFDFKGYKIINPKDYEYPDGINLIGTKGGTVSLTGVGKIEIPEGALDKEIFVSLKQEKKFDELSDIITGKVVLDYVSSVMKIVPEGLVLNKPALVYLNTNKDRIGRNSPAIVKWSLVNKNDENYYEYGRDENSYIFYSEKITKNITSESPAEIKKLGVVFKCISSNIKPTDHYLILGDEDGFKINATQTIPTIPNAYKITVTYNDLVTEKTEAYQVLERSLNAYDYYLSPINGVNVNSKIKRPSVTSVTIEKTSSELGGAITTILPLIDPYITLNDINVTVEHELWHVLQATNSSSTFAYIGIPVWIKEASAEHMGARVFKNNYKSSYANTLQVGETYTQYHYQNALSVGFDDLKKSSNLDLYDSYDPYGYNKVGFFTFLANANTKPTSDCGSDNCDKYMFDIVKNYNSINYKLFHDYTLHALIKDRFDIYDLSNRKTQIKPDIISLKPDKNNKTNKNSTSVSLENNSAKYLEFKLDATSPRARSLGIAVKTSGSGCESSSKIRVLFYDATGNNTIVLPQYLDPNSGAEEIDSKYLNLGMFTEKKALNLKSGQIYPFLNFGEDFSKAVLILSNSNGQVGTGNTCNYEVESCLLCFDNK